MMAKTEPNTIVTNTIFSKEKKIPVAVIIGTVINNIGVISIVPVMKKGLAGFAIPEEITLNVSSYMYTPTIQELEKDITKYIKDKVDIKVEEYRYNGTTIVTATIDRVIIKYTYKSNDSRTVVLKCKVPMHINGLIFTNKNIKCIYDADIDTIDVYEYRDSMCHKLYTLNAELWRI